MISNLSKTIFVCSMSILIVGLASAAVVHAEDDYGGSSHSGHDEANRSGAGEISHMGTNQNTSSPEGPSARKSSPPADLEAIQKLRADLLSQLESMTVTQDTETTPSCMLLRSAKGISELICGTGHNQDVLLIDKVAAADTQRRLESGGGVTIPFDTQMQVCALADDNFLTSTARSFLAAASVASRGAGVGVAALNKGANNAFVLAAAGGTWSRLWRKFWEEYVTAHPVRPKVNPTDEQYKRLMEETHRKAQQEAKKRGIGPLESRNPKIPGTVWKEKPKYDPKTGMDVHVDSPHPHDAVTGSQHGPGLIYPHGQITVGKDKYYIYAVESLPRPVTLDRQQYEYVREKWCNEIERLMVEAQTADEAKRKQLQAKIDHLMREMEKYLKKIANQNT